MIIEVRCCDCDKHIGYFSIQGDTDGLEDTKYVKSVKYHHTMFVIICDKCREGRIELEGEK